MDGRGTHHLHRDLSFSLEDVPAAHKFVERPGDMEELESHLLPNSQCRCNIFVLHGLGGIGKTLLAAHFAHHHRTTFTSVLWLNAQSDFCLRRDLEVYGRKILDIQGGVADGGDLASTALDWLFGGTNTGWLLVLDQLGGDCARTSALESQYIHRCLRGSHGSVLVTTRLSQLAQLGHSMVLRRVGQATSVSILQKWCERGSSDEHREKPPPTVIMFSADPSLE